MKIYFVAMLTLVALMSCSGNVKNKVEGSDAQQAATGQGQELVVDAAASSIHWKGTKPGGDHVGTIGLKNGSLVIDGEKLVSGSFVINMNDIVNTDLTDEKSNEMLVNHLKSADFFDVAVYPESVFTITGGETVTGNDSINYKISGNLKMKDVEKNITFGAKISKDGDTYTAETVPFSIDRVQWNVKYASKSIFADLKDKFINDNIELHIKIVAKAQ